MIEGIPMIDSECDKFAKCTKCNEKTKDGVIICYKCYNNLLNEKDDKVEKSTTIQFNGKKYLPPDTRILRGHKRRVFRKPVEEINDDGE